MPPRKAPRSSPRAVAAAWKAFYETPEGKAAIGAFMAYCGVFSEIEGPDLGIEVGKRNAAIWLAMKIGMKPDVFVDERSDVDRVFEQLG